MSLPDFDALRNTISELQKEDISFTDLGQVNDFSAAEDHKQFILETLSSELERTAKLRDSAPKPLIMQYFNKLNSTVVSTGKHVGKVKDLATNGKDKPEFHQQRPQLVNNLEGLKKNLEGSLLPEFTYLAVYELAAKVKSLDASGLASKMAVAYAETERNKIAVEKILGSLRDRVADVTSAAAQSGFSNLAMQHEKLSGRWMAYSFWTGLILLLCAVGFTVWSVLLGTSLESLGAAVKGGIIVAVLSAVIRITLKKHYNERNLSILYRHRANVLEQYSLFEKTIGDDAQMKNQFRLEIAKYLFTDPATGYIAGEKGEAINVNPVFGYAEKMSGKA